jgi:hypothetical protein
MIHDALAFPCAANAARLYAPMIQSNRPKASGVQRLVCLLCIDIHLLANARLAIANVLHSHVLADVFLCDDLLVQDRGSTSLELVVALLRLPRVRCQVVPEQLGLVLGDDANVDVGTRAQIVPDTGLDRVGAEADGLLSGHVWLPLSLEDAHGSQTSGTHGNVWELVRRTVCVDCEEVCSGGVASCHHEICANVTLVAEQMLFEHGHDSDDARLAASGEGVEFEVGGHERSGELSVGGGTGTSTPDLRGDVMKLLAVLWKMLVSWPRALDRGLYTLSATMGPLVARVSAAMTTPPS